ncbi:hypothetical protein P8452_75346 [Trifolium repens]|nr:hypothetical protein P8452_75346 [Trifolium repens]
MEQNKANGVGLQLSRPKFLRTKWGDLPLAAHEGGEGSNSLIVEAVGLLEAGSGGPVPVANVEPIQCDVSNLNSVLPLPSTVRNKGGRTKKTMKKSCPYHPYLPGSKHQRFYELSKGGTTAKKRGGLRGLSSNSRTSSNESDPIANSRDEGQGNSEQHVHDDEGIQLEVVLPSPDLVEVSSEEGLLPLPVPTAQRGGGNGSSGLAVLIREQMVINNGDTVSDWMVEKDRGDAHHIIDIQEDLGLTFRDAVEENVERCMKMEQRDRLLKNDWEHSNGYQ